MTEQAAQSQTAQAATPPKEDTKEYNFELLRKKLESSEREKKELQAKASEYEKRVSELQKAKSQSSSEEEDHYDEPYVDERRLNKKLGKLKEDFSKEVEERAEAKARMIVEQERTQTFLKQNPDFAQVLSPEIIEKFAQKHPEIAEPMLETPDSFARQKLLYQAIKLSGVHKPPEPKQSVQEKIEKNMRSPYYQPSGIGTAPYAGGGDFSESRMKASYEKIQALKKNLRI